MFLWTELIRKGATLIILLSLVLYFIGSTPLILYGNVTVGWVDFRRRYLFSILTTAAAAAVSQEKYADSYTLGIDLNYKLRVQTSIKHSMSGIQSLFASSASS